MQYDGTKARRCMGLQPENDLVVMDLLGAWPSLADG